MAIIDIKKPEDLDAIIANSNAPKQETNFIAKAAKIWRKRGQRPNQCVMGKIKAFAKQRL